jgi:hypothetical protein
MIYELRVYEVFPGKMEAVNRRFAEVTVPLWEQLGVKIVGFWTTVIGPSHNQLVYILAFDSLGQREEIWQKFKNHPDWLAALAETEKDGPLVKQISNSFMAPTSYSPLQ